MHTPCTHTYTTPIRMHIIHNYPYFITPMCLQLCAMADCCDHLIIINHLVATADDEGIALLLLKSATIVSS